MKLPYFWLGLRGIYKRQPIWKMNDAATLARKEWISRSGMCKGHRYKNNFWTKQKVVLWSQSPRGTCY